MIRHSFPVSDWCKFEPKFKAEKTNEEEDTLYQLVISDSEEKNQTNDENKDEMPIRYILSRID